MSRATGQRGKEDNLDLPADYAGLLTDIKQRIGQAQTRAVLAVNAELVRLYWEIGAMIDRRQHQEGWGAGVIPRLARDLHNELPEEKGFSERNIKRMLAFYREYPHLEFVPQPVAQIESGSKVPPAVALFPADLIQSIPVFVNIVVAQESCMHQVDIPSSGDSFSIVQPGSFSAFSSLPDLSGLRKTGPMGSLRRVLPLQRSGWADRAFS